MCDDDGWSYLESPEDRALPRLLEDALKEEERHAVKEEDQKDAEFDKKKGQMYPCVECRKVFGHREMIGSRG